MLFCLSLIAVLLYDTVFASVCSQTFREAPGQIEAVSLLSPQLGYNQCEYVIHAPGDSYITLNFTLLHGFESQLDVHGRLCLPEVEIAEVDAHGTISVMSRICRNAPPPLVFQSKTHIIKLTYVWVAKHPSRFSLDFDFHRKYSDSSGPCEFTCVDQGCLSSWSLVCNGIPDCLDQSDERDCPLPLPSSDSPDTDDVSSIQIIIIVIAIVLTLGILTCVVSHYKMGARSWSERRHRHPQHHQQGHHHHDDPNSSTVLYVPTATHERFLHEAAVQRDRQIRLASVQLDLKLNLPPSIALPDGEEQPYGSLQHLHLRDPEQESEIYRECIRPPPNRTVFDGESPPPYRSSSVGILNPQSNSTPPPRIVRGWNGTPLVMRCHSMSTNNNTTPRNSNTSSLSHSPHLPSHHHQHNPPLPTNLRLGPGARQSVCTTDRHSVDDFHGEPPPGYSEVIANPSVYSSLHPNSGV